MPAPGRYSTRLGAAASAAPSPSDMAGGVGPASPDAISSGNGTPVSTRLTSVPAGTAAGAGAAATAAATAASADSALSIAAVVSSSAAAALRRRQRAAA